MSSIALVEPYASSAVDRARLYVSWQDPESRSIEPVGRLDRVAPEGEVVHEFRYLRRAEMLKGFQPFVSFPDLDRTYRSRELFPLFENRLMPRSRSDYPSFVQALGLLPDADPFEVLARSEGRRQTDTVEVFPEPSLHDGIARCRFLVHGIRHFPGAQEAIGSLQIGERLYIMLDSQNPVDVHAVVLRDDGRHLLGWVPRYLSGLVREPLASLGPDVIEVQVEHVGASDGPLHLRLLCVLRTQWPAETVWLFDRPEFEVVDAT